MIRHFVLPAALISGALFSAPGLSMAAPPTTAPPELQKTEIKAAIEGESKRTGILEATRSKTKSSESTESIDCFYEANKFQADCQNTKPTAH